MQKKTQAKLQKSSGMGVLVLIFGILGIFFLWMPPLSLLFSILAILIYQTGGKKELGKSAVVGSYLGATAILLMFAIIIVALIIGMSL